MVCFIFAEPAAWWFYYATGIGIGYIVKIREDYYRVMGNPPPQRFALRGEKNLNGWKFEAQKITNPVTIKALDKREIDFLVLSPKLVKECNERGVS